MRQKAGTAEESRDADFDVLARKYEASACATERLLLDMKKYVEGVRSMLEHQRELANCFKHVLRAGDQAAGCGLAQLEASRSEILQTCERDLAGKGLFVLGELVAVQKAIAAKITKRAHKLLDYDRHLHTAKKFEQINERSISEERKMAQAERALEEAQEEYEKYNEQLKRDLPRYFELEARLVEPILATLIAFQRTLYAKQREAHALILGSAAEEEEYRTILGGYEAAVGEAQAQLNELSLLQAATGRVKKSSGPAHTRTLSSSSSSSSASATSGSSVRSLKSATATLSSPREVPLRTVSPTTPAVEPQKPREERMAPMMAAMVPKTAVPAPPPQKPPTKTPSLPPPTGSLRASVEDRLGTNPPAPAAPTMIKSPSGSRVAELAARLGAIQVAAPPKPSNNNNNTSSSSINSPPLASASKGGNAPPSLPPKKLIVRAEYDFVGPEAGDLSFKAGDLVEVISRTDSTEDWWTGRIGDRTGTFPANYCTMAAIAPPPLRPLPQTQS